MRTFASILITAFAIMLIAVGCTGSKAFAKKGAKLEATGMYAEAADMYLQSLQRNNANVDAKIGLKKTGQQLLNDKLSTFFKAFSMGDSKENAVNAYLDAKAYADRANQLGVVLDIPGNYVTDFNQVKGEYLVQLYTQGQDLMAKQDFASAENVFKKIGALEPGYKDASSLQDIAYLEPLYRSGKDALANAHYRKAYDDLGKVVAKNASYKDAGTMRNDALTKGRYSIAVLPFSGPMNQRDQTARVEAYATTSLTEVDDPFIKVVDRSDIQRILDEQRLGMSGVVDEKTAVSAGKLMGAQAVLMGTLIDYREEVGQVKRSTKDGYESYQVKQIDATTGQPMLITKYKPVKYTEYLQENKVYASFNYKLVSLETGEVLLSRVVDQQKADHAYYAGYDGDRSALLPSVNGAVDPNNSSRQQLMGLLNASHEVKPTDMLGKELLGSACNGMAGTIMETISSRIP